MAENYESVFLTGVRPNGAFDRHVTKTWIRSFYGATMGQIFEILTYRYFDGPESFPPEFFTYFGHPTAENYESVFLTVVRLNDAFDQCATKTGVRSFCSSCDYFPISLLLTNGATNGRLMKSEHEKMLSITR